MVSLRMHALIPGSARARRQSPNKPSSLSTVAALGVLYWQLDADAWETDERFEAIRKVQGYTTLVRTDCRLWHAHYPWDYNPYYHFLFL